MIELKTIFTYLSSAVLLVFVACSSNSKGVETETDNSFQVLDSLRAVEGLSVLETRVYKTKDEKLIIYNYKHCGDGVYQLTAPHGCHYGRLYTHRGDAENPDAEVYQLVPFDGGAILNFRYQDDELLLLNSRGERVNESAVNTVYTADRLSR